MSDNSSRGTQFEALRVIVYKRDGYACVYCGRTTDLSLDHVLAKARGGKDELSNLVTACIPCNSGKGTKTNARLNRFNPEW